MAHCLAAMATQEVCHQYWPVGGIEQYGEFAVSPLEETLHNGFRERIFSVTDSKAGCSIVM